MLRQPQRTIRASHVSRYTIAMRYARKSLALAMAASLVCIGLLNRAQAQGAANDLDPSFGINGKVTTDFFGGNDSATAVAIQPDGKIVVAGWAKPGTSDTDFSDFALARYRRDGSLDANFGNGGKMTTDFLGFDDSVTKLAIQSNGKIVAAGYAKDNAQGNSTQLALACYNRDGSLDDGSASDSTPADSFGDGGKVTSDFLKGTRGIVLQSGGKILAVGTVGDDFALVRYNSDGSLDTNFGDGGKVLTDVYNSGLAANAVILQPDGKIVVGGTAIDHEIPPFERADFALVRYNKNGSLDDGSASDSTPADSFGDEGKVTADMQRDMDFLNDIALQPDGKILASGHAFSYCCSGVDAVLARFNSDGSLDDGSASDSTPADSFGHEGKLSSGVGTVSSFKDVLVQPNGTIVMAQSTSFNFNGNFIVTGYNSGEGFRAFVDFTGNAVAVALQPDGRIVAVGSTTLENSFSGSDFAIARLYGEPVSTAINSLTLAASTVPGSTNLIGTITLNTPAPQGGLVVALSSTNDAASVPATIRIPAGQTTRTFNIKTTPELTKQAGNIIARVGNSTKSVSFVVQPLGVASLSLNPGTVEGSSLVTGVVTLNSPAPAGGINVQLSSRNPSVASPVASSINIPAGARVKSFTIRAADVASTRTAVITATANGVSKSAILTVN